MIRPQRQLKDEQGETGRRHRRLKRLAELPVLPTLLTAGNLACGVTAILCASGAEGLLLEGAVLIFVAMFFDMLDGKVARLTNTEGEFGAELDSLADVVSFGVAPAMLVHRLVLGEPSVTPWVEGERLIWLILLLYAVFTAFRLARYNVEHSDEPTDHFRGIPSPGAAAFLCSWVLFYAFYAPGNAERPDRTTFLVEWIGQDAWKLGFRYFIMAGTVLMAVLMISRIHFPHFGNTLLSGKLGFRRMILLLLLLGCMVTWPLYGLILCTTGYVLLGLVPGLVHSSRRWAKGRSILDEDDDDPDERAD